MHCANDQPLFNFESNATRQFIQGLVFFQKAYAPIHGRICVLLCLFGVVTNLIHCLVLTRPRMRVSAVNVIMTAVALCDLGTMSSYLVYIVHFVINNTPDTCSNSQTYWWMLFLLLHIFFSILLHTATLWLAVVMAFIRRMTLHRNILYSQWQRASLARHLSLCVIGAIFLLSIPSLLVHEIIEFPHHRWTPSPKCSAHFPNNYSESLFTVVIRQSALANGCVLFKTNLWLTGICFKVIPCVLLFALSGSLMQKLRKAEKKQSALLVNGLLHNDPMATAHRRSSAAADGVTMTGGGGATPLMLGSAASSLKKINSDRTTAILLAILTVFLLTELPQGLIAILNAIYTADVHRFIYLTLGDILDLLSLVNSSVNFVLYCFMSSRYRQTFCSLLIPFIGCKRCVAHSANPPMVPSFASQAVPINNNGDCKGENGTEMTTNCRKFGNVMGKQQVVTEAGGRRRSTPSYRWLRGSAEEPPSFGAHPKLSVNSLRPPPTFGEF